MLDDQATAKKYEGQEMVMTGTLNATHNTMYLRKIEAVCELPVYRLSGFTSGGNSGFGGGGMVGSPVGMPGGIFSRRVACRETVTVVVENW